MKVILLQDVKSLGKKGEIVTVNDGYARNMILPKKLGLEATPKNVNDLKLQGKHAEKQAQEELEAAQQKAEELKGKTIELKMKSGEGGRTFGSISAKEIAEAAKSQFSFEIDKKKMTLEEPIRALGSYEVSIKLHKDVTGVLRVKVSAAD